MKLELRGHDERYVVEQSLMNLFPGEKPVYEPIGPGEDNWAVITVDDAPGLCRVTVELSHQGKTASQHLDAPLSGTDFEQEGQRRHAIGRCFFLAARAVTGDTPPWGMLTGVRPDKPATWALAEGRAPEDVRAMLEQAYFVTPDRAALAVETGAAALAVSRDLAPRDIAVYVGIPFCPTRCAYCSFVSQSVEKSFALVEPDVVLMTNIGDSHIEHFGSREKILEAKSEIFHHVKSGAFVVINGDDPLLNTLPGKLPYAFTRVGAGEGLDYRAEGLVSDGKSHMTCEVKTPHNSFRVEIPALGDHMIYPTLMAAAVGEHFGLTQTQIADGVLHFAPTKMRMNLLHRGDDITILNDTYNANPQSMRAAVEVLSSARGAYKVAVLGDMFELGPLAPALHAGVGDYLGKAGIDCLVAVGELARHIHDAAQAAGVPECYYCPTKAEARPVLDGVVRPHATILVKASRGMALEELVDYLLTITGEA